MTFILAVTTYSRLPYLKRLIQSWYSTRSGSCNWQLIVADDGSGDGIIAYLEQLAEEEPNFTLIRNQRQGVHHQTNSIIKVLERLSFDMCFKCDDDVTFLEKGWDLAYYEAAKASGFGHLCFYDKEWAPEKNLEQPIVKGSLACHCSPEDVQGAFFTLTPAIIQSVGYFDVENFGFKGLGHLDFTFRCCRLGFNDIDAPYDLLNSNDYLELSGKEDYKRSTSIRLDRQINPPGEVQRKLALVAGPERKYIPYRAGPGLRPEGSELEEGLADDSFYPSDGVYSVAGTILKRVYNFHVQRGWMWFPRLIKKMGKVLMKLGRDFYFIDR